MRELLDDVFQNDENTWISFTSHSGSIGAILSAIEHRQFSLLTGAVIPALVKAERIHSPPPRPKIDPWNPPPTC
jgi:hypothetical protein